MLQNTSILVVAETREGATPDLLAEFVCHEVRRRGEQVQLIQDRVLSATEARAVLRAMHHSTPCAVILVGRLDRHEMTADPWLALHPNLVVAMVPIGDDSVLIQRSQPHLGQLIDAIQDLVENGSRLRDERTFQFKLPIPTNDTSSGAIEIEGACGQDDETVTILDLEADDVLRSEEPPALPPPRILLDASLRWAHVLLKRATGRLFGENGGGIEFTRVQVIDWLDEREPHEPLMHQDEEVAAADAALSAALDEASHEAVEPLAVAWQALDLNPLEFRILVLALAPELDPRHQHWISLLMMDDPGRRVGTLGLYAELIGVSSEVVVDVARSGRLARWRVFDGALGTLPAGDAPLRLDPPLRAWLLGAPGELERADPSLRPILLDRSWPGAALVEDGKRAQNLVTGLGADSWSLLAGDGGPAAWRALVEAGAAASDCVPIRASLLAAAALHPADSAEAGLRLARFARLTGRPLVLDAADVQSGRPQDEALGALLHALGSARVAGTIITGDPARIVRLLGIQAYRIEKEIPSASSRLAALTRAAAEAGAHFTAEAAESLANLYPLQIDGLEQAMRLALARPVAPGADALRARFITACKEVSAEGATGLAQRIEPIFELCDVVLPADRKGQLEEIVDNVRFAPKVLEGWKFRDQLPYGIGVSALFHGPSGTGKTMASMAVAKRLGVQLLRIDLSRVVSKYIGETEKNIDAVFVEAQLSGAGLLIDEADGLLARRSEVKDAHDRYANLEVAYLLQRMEAFEGLCILTTNFRQNLDSAFLRRLRFIVEFPRPDAAAREEIWRRCLPADSHALDDATFRVLARRIELTGGNIRQITLRAAFLAAAAGTRIGPSHVAHAARAEFAKLGLPPVELDLVERAAA